MHVRLHARRSPLALSLAALKIGLAGAIAALAIGCDAPLPAPAAAADSMRTTPALVSTDAKGAEQRRAAMQSWIEQSLIASYRAAGHRDEKWNAGVERAFRTAARRWANDPTAPADISDRVWTDTTAAITAGCTDPLVAYVRQRFAWTAAAHELNDAVTRLEASAHSAHWKGWAALAREQELRPCCLLSETDPGKEFRAAQVARARAHLPAIVGDRTVPTRRVVQYANRLLQAYMWFDQEYERHYDDVRAAIVAARGDRDPSLPLLEAWFHVRLGQGARGQKWASQTSDAQFATLAREMHIADQLTARAAAAGADPVDVTQLAAAVAWGRSDRDALETWFEVGTSLEPGDYEWYDDKVNWLQERWFGSDEELLAFGRALLAKRRYEGRVSMVLLDAHHRVQLGPPKKTGYHARPDVCADYVSIYDGLLERYPEAWGDRNRYLWRLVECQDWAGASRQLAALGPAHVTYNRLRGQEAYDATKAWIERRGTSQAADGAKGP